MANTIRCTLALALLVAACGDDSGADDTNAGGGDGGSYTLDDALQTSGTDTSDQRAGLLFDAACMKRIVCEPEALQSCIDIEQQMYDAGKRAGFDSTCLDKTLDSYACLATHECSEFDTACDSATAAALSACSKYLGDGG